MIATKRFLEQCERLKRLGYSPPLREGMRVSRGYADLGFEEFLLLPPRKLLSLYTGKTSELLEAHEHFFFAVPNIDTIIDEIQRRYFDIGSIVFEEQRTWVVTLHHANEGNEFTVRDQSLLEAVGSAFEEVLLRSADASSLSK